MQFELFFRASVKLKSNWRPSFLLGAREWDWQVGTASDGMRTPHARGILQLKRKCKSQKVNRIQSSYYVPLSLRREENRGLEAVGTAVPVLVL